MSAAEEHDRAKGTEMDELAYDCQECGALCEGADHYHPYLYCELVKLGHRDPAAYLAQYGFVPAEDAGHDGRQVISRKAVLEKALPVNAHNNRAAEPQAGTVVRDENGWLWRRLDTDDVDDRGRHWHPIEDDGSPDLAREPETWTKIGPVTLTVPKRSPADLPALRRKVEAAEIHSRSRFDG